MNRAPSPRISEILFETREPSFASMAALPSNVEAIEAALLFSTGVHSHLAVVGPSGWGKTHLLGAICTLVSREKDPTIDLMTVPEYLAGSGHGDPHHLVLDDVQEVLGKPRQRQALQIALERRVRSARPAVLAFTAPKPSRQLRSMLPSPRDWSIVAMAEPHPVERVLLLNHMARHEALQLSPRLVRILAMKMQGDGRTYTGALKRLRTAGSSWQNPEETLRAIGLLDPFFADNETWDLKVRILQVADQSRSHFQAVSPLDLALFTMLHKAELGEADIARAASISPAAVYHRANRFRRQALTCDMTASCVRRFVELVVSSLAEEL